MICESEWFNSTTTIKAYPTVSFYHCRSRFSEAPIALENLVAWQNRYIPLVLRVRERPM